MEMMGKLKKQDSNPKLVLEGGAKNDKDKEKDKLKNTRNSA